MKTVRSVFALIMVFCLAFGSCATAGQVLEGDANVDQRNYPSTTPFIHPPFYNVRLTVETNDNGVITAVKDNGTGEAGSVQEGNEEAWAKKNKPFFDNAVNGGLFDRFVGKTLEEVKAMDMTSGGADAVSGATMVSAAAQEAVINAMEGRNGKAFLPNEGNVLPLESIEGNTVILKNELPADFDLQVLDIRWSVYNDEIVPADSYTAESMDGKLVITFADAAALKPGYYYVNVTDASGTYRSPAFEGGPAAAQAPYFIVESGLSAEDISFDGEKIVLNGSSMADYLKNIRHVQILADGDEKAVEQEVVGHHGTVGNFIALDENGTLNADGVVKARNGDETPLFESGKQYTVAVDAFGYPELVFPYSKPDSTTETSSEIIEIDTAEDLIAMNQNLSGHYILTADIDLSGYENWPMIGAYVMDPNSPEGEDPVAEAAFSGTFDGNGHTISNVTIDASADMEKMFGIGFFACVGHGGVVKNVVFQDINVKGMMLVGGAVGYAFECTVDNVDLTATGRNRIESTMVMAGGVIGGLTCSACVNCDVENTDVIAAPGGNSGILGGGFSKPVLENCSVKHSTLSGSMEGVPAFGMDGGNWLGGLTGCINLDDYDVQEWYVKNCTINDVDITISGKGAYVGGLTGSAGGELKNTDDPRMLISGCTLENVKITVTDNIHCVGGIVGGSFSEGGPFHSFRIDGCTLTNVSITTDAENLEASQTGMLIGQAANCQLTGNDGKALDITDRTVPAEGINSSADVSILHADGNAYEDAMPIGQIVADNAEGNTEANALLENIKGTYEPLFPVITKPEYNQLWLDACTAVLGDETAASQTADMLKWFCSGTVYGQEAIDAYGDGSSGMQFDCLFINGVSTITFDGTVISGADENGNQVFSHEYACVGNLSLSGMMDGYLFETADENAGEFRYFFIMPDTPATTYHLEFRYGSDTEDLAKYNEGVYAYWLASGFPVDADEDLIRNVIHLFCLENLDYSAHTETALKTLNELGFEGKWVADMSVFGEAYAGVELYMTIDGNGHGLTFMNGQQTRDFEAYAVDNGEKGDGAGLYVAYDNEAKEPEAAPYTIVTDGNGQTVLTFFATDGTISWVKAE